MTFFEVKKQNLITYAYGFTCSVDAVLPKMSAAAYWFNFNYADVQLNTPRLVLDEPAPTWEYLIVHLHN